MAHILYSFAVWGSRVICTLTKARSSNHYCYRKCYGIQESVAYAHHPPAIVVRGTHGMAAWHPSVFPSEPEGSQRQDGPLWQLTKSAAVNKEDHVWLYCLTRISTKLPKLQPPWISDLISSVMPEQRCWWCTKGSTIYFQSFGMYITVVVNHILAACTES